jgi:predicted  nucleic acid-binding Zn-ribbon protein
MMNVTLNEHVSELKSKSEELENEISSTRKQNDELSSEISVLKSSIEKECHEHATVVDDLNPRLAKVEDEMSRKSAMNKDMVSKLRTSIAELESE